MRGRSCRPRCSVLTFTRAATPSYPTASAPGCWRRRGCSEGDAEATDPLLVSCWPPTATRPAPPRAGLAAAAEGMDDAAVFTIDAWCQRMLREHAFDSGSLFDEELVPDDGVLRDPDRARLLAATPTSAVARPARRGAVGVEGRGRIAAPTCVRCCCGAAGAGRRAARCGGRPGDRGASARCWRRCRPVWRPMREWLEAQYAAGLFREKQAPAALVPTPTSTRWPRARASPAALRKALGDKGCERLTPAFLAEGVDRHRAVRSCRRASTRSPS